MASVKPLGNGKFEATVFVCRDASGKQEKRKKRFDSEREAKTWARDLEKEIEERKYTNMDKTRASTWFDDWLKLNKNSLSPSTYLSYKMYVNAHFKPAFGTFKLGQITEHHIKKYINDKLDINNKPKKLSSTTVRKHILVLREILYDALKEKSPCRDIEIPKPEKYKPYVLSEKEFEQIHDAVRGTRDEPIVLLSAWCGLRLGEIFCLKWDDVSWEKSIIRIDENRAISEDGYVDKEPKSDNGLRDIVVPLPLMNILKSYRLEQATPDTSKKGEIPESKKALRRWTRRLLKRYESKTINDVPDEQKEEFLAELRDIQSRIFLMRPDSYSTYFGELVDEKKLPDVRFHDLRHYHATWMYNQHIPDQYAAQRLGHDIKTLKGIYQHLAVDVKKEMDNIILAGFGEHGEQKGNKSIQKN